ncbi:MULTISPECIES: DUF2017 domain-containing protein [Streptomycetaceae]|uniref:DUF2017 domain-containing protein n=1 Tax=Streptantibioticus cattleyicolor (strain ATCC 35852 / DSM 46488 / JCM 4925 / NBRC 14057 / NRRL 8057) TaxID=1003195 RepID=F8JU99_STREN|nr:MULTISPECIES: DUF2017 domain-containing protein [Streptomycetaceae]AEW94308.1 hypothetical protein SCATT_19370 [Streptantibioticus cattleyicolor NRRL 8057 = DSM 46488]MYS58963.1 DUF2017 family protein [Streptomyces sp. SID5468]CCB74665.1 conserved protein of unknown function [Streptantibioticus cattleyicolor NRRL 8057 = DSM 46488]
MAGYFEAAPDGGAAIALDEVEISILRSLAVQLLELIGPGPGGADEDAEADPLAALFAEGPTRPPADPALARLFPSAYVDPAKEPDEESEAASAEFRRYTENDLRARKREDALAVVRALDALAPDAGGGAVLRLAPAAARQWLGALNDLRLTIGVRLEVSEDQDSALYRLPDSDPRKPLVMAYLWLGGLQETLIEALMP